MVVAALEWLASTELERDIPPPGTPLSRLLHVTARYRDQQFTEGAD